MFRNNHKYSICWICFHFVAVNQWHYRTFRQVLHVTSPVHKTQLKPVFLGFSVSSIFGAFLPFLLLGITCPDITLAQTSVCFSLCISWSSPLLPHFPHPVRQSLVCLWNGSSAGLRWDVTEKGRSAAPSPLCSSRVPSVSVSSDLVFGLIVHAFVRERERALYLCTGSGPFCLFALDVDVTLSLCSSLLKPG